MKLRKKMSNEKETEPKEELESDVVTSKQALQVQSTESVIVENFVKFFEPLIQKLDANVHSLRLSQCDLTNQIKNLLNRKYILF